MTIDRSHLGWAAFTLGASGVASGLYFLTFHPELFSCCPTTERTTNGMVRWLQGGSVTPITERAGGTPLGLIYGGTALVIFLFAALIGSRRKHPTWNVGSMQTWLKGHIWLTLLTIPLVVYHSGMHLGGPLTQFLATLYMVVMVSGIFGLILQHLLPHLMRQLLPEESVFEQIPFLCSKLAEEARMARKDLHNHLTSGEHGGSTTLTVAQTKKAEVAFRIIDQEIIPFLQLGGKRTSRLGRPATADRLFKFMAQEIPAGHRGPIEQLKALCEQKRRMNVQTLMQHWLHGWILLHAPTSLLLIVVTIWHAVVAAYIY